MPAVVGAAAAVGGAALAQPMLPALVRLVTQARLVQVRESELAQAVATQPAPVIPQPKPAAAEVVVAAGSVAVADAAAPPSNPAPTPSHLANWPERLSLPWASPRRWK